MILNQLFRLGRNMSMWLKSRTSTDPHKMTFSAYSHELARQGHLMGYLRCLIIDLAFSPWEHAHCAQAWAHSQTGIKQD